MNIDARAGVNWILQIAFALSRVCTTVFECLRRRDFQAVVLMETLDATWGYIVTRVLQQVYVFFRYAHDVRGRDDRVWGAASPPTGQRHEAGHRRRRPVFSRLDERIQGNVPCRQTQGEHQLARLGRFKIGEPSHPLSKFVADPRRLRSSDPPRAIVSYLIV